MSVRAVPCAVGILLALSTPLVAFGQGCSQLAQHGVFNTASNDSDSLKTQALINWISQNSFESYDQAKESAAKLGFSIDVLPVALGGHSRETDWHGYQAYLQTLDFNDPQTLGQFSQTVKSADKGLSEAFTDCISSRSGVVHAVIEWSHDPKLFTIKLIYQPVGPPPEAVILNFVVTPSTVVCSPKIRRGSVITEHGIILNCTRRSPTDTVQVTGSTNKGPLSVKLSGLTPSVETPPISFEQAVIVKAENVPTDFKLRNTMQHSGCSCEGDQVYFPDGEYNVKVNQEFNFRYDASPTWHGQAFDKFRGTVNWGPTVTSLHDFHPWDYQGIGGTLKVTFFKPGDYNAVVLIAADCLDAFYKCRNTCTAHGAIKVHVE
jgi:hypothetical protein